MIRRAALTIVQSSDATGTREKSLPHAMTERHPIVTGNTALVSTLVVVFLVLIGGLVYSLRLKDVLRYPDEKSYVALARNLVEHQAYTLDGARPTAYRPPGYPLLLASVAYAGGGILAFRILNQVAFCAGIFLLFRIVRKQGNKAAGFPAVALSLCYPVLFYTAGTLYPQTVAALLFLSTIAVYFNPAGLNFKRAAFIGILSGLLILTAPTFLFFLAFLCAWKLFEKRKRAFMPVAVVVLFSGLTLTPWTVRNYRALDSIVFVSTNSGVNLLLGNSENTTANAGVNVDISSYRQHTGEMSETERNRHYAREAIGYVLSHPARSAKLYLLKFLNYFNYRNKLWTEDEGSIARDMVMLVTYGTLLALAGLRLVLASAVPLSRYERFAAALYVLNGAFAAIFFTRIRFRIPFDYLLISLAASSVTIVHRRFAGVRRVNTRQKNKGFPTT